MIDQLTLWRDFIRTISTGSLPFHLEVRPGPLLVVSLGVHDIDDRHATRTGKSESLPPFPGTPLVEVRYQGVVGRKVVELP